MYKIFYVIIGIVVIFNLCLVLIPDGKYEKYISLFVGIVIMLISAETFWGNNVEISLPDLNFENETTYESNRVSTVALEQWIEGIAEGHFEGEVQIKVYKHGSEIHTIEVHSNFPVTEEGILWLSKQCDINREKFLIK